MCIGAQEGASGSAALRRAAPPHRPLGPFGLGAASHTCVALCAIVLFFIHHIIRCYAVLDFTPLALYDVMVAPRASSEV